MIQTVWYDTEGRVKCVDDGDSKATVPGHDKATADTDSVGEITLDHVVTVENGQVVSATFDPPPKPEPTKQQLDAYARRLAVDKRRAVMGATDGVSDAVLQSEFLSLQGRAAAMMRRETSGRGKPGESGALDQLEAQADALGAIDAALETVRGKIADDTYMTEADIDGAAEWP